MSDAPTGTDNPQRSNRLDSLTVLVYSDDADTRRQVIDGLGERPHPDLAPLTFREVATAAVVIRELDSHTVDLVILDGEAAPVGGLGIAKQLKDEIDDCPPVVVLIGRAADRWLADWSRAEAVVPHPIDPFVLTDAVVSALRR
ncbi:ANTAR domain-containing protein [Williamsia sterculiae]|uniref:Response regulatory domain-containing protein n=1 Tax=Williamsia sterculiae TaxID=1344003 RepID=A0A1N7F789_9NOCA|nr:response regulator transcription factor [Williamsia sterculiae]SIR96180.1 hypothetical protein SAMN05445060_1889 [Williamsia sterculiae]